MEPRKETKLVNYLFAFFNFVVGPPNADDMTVTGAAGLRLFNPPAEPPGDRPTLAGPARPAIKGDKPGSLAIYGDMPGVPPVDGENCMTLGEAPEAPLPAESILLPSADED